MFLGACASIHGKAKNPKQLTAEEYLQWYESSNYPYRDTAEVNGITYVCSFQPRQSEIARQYLNKVITQEEATAYLKEGEDLLQFQFQVFLPQAGTDVFHYQLKEGESTSSRTSYFSFGIKSDLKINYETSGTADCSSVHFERGISNFPVSKFMAYFPVRQEKVTSITFDAAVFGQPKVNFEFNHLLTNNLPKLKL